MITFREACDLEFRAVMIDHDKKKGMDDLP